MKSPHDERATLLHQVIGRATDDLKAPIERIEVVGNRVDCWSKSRHVSLVFSYSHPGYFVNQGNDNPPMPGAFIPYAGSGSWDIRVVEKPKTSKSVLVKHLAKRAAIMALVVAGVCGLIMLAADRLNLSMLGADVHALSNSSAPQPVQPPKLH